MSDSTSPACFRCVSLEREIHRLRCAAARDFDELQDLAGDNRSLRRAVKRLRLLLDAAEDRVAELEAREDAPDGEDPAP